MLSGNMGGNAGTAAHRVCVVYEEPSGRILHIHHEISLHKGPHATEAETEAAALAQLRKRRQDAGSLRVLHIKPEELQPQVRYKVDPRKRVLERLP